MEPHRNLNPAIFDLFPEADRQYLLSKIRVYNCGICYKERLIQLTEHDPINMMDD